MAVTHKNVQDQVLDYFVTNIEDGTWHVNEKIPSENQLSSELGVSRATIRQTVSLMAGIGILNSIHGKGTYLLDDNVSEALYGSDRITAADCRDTEKMLEYRRIVECEVCFLVAQKRSEKLVDRLKKEYQDMCRAAESDDNSAFIDADIAFHKTIYKAMDNVILEKSMNRVFAEMRKYQEITRELNGYENGLTYHGLILDAIIAGDGEKARDYMFDHLLTASNNLNPAQLEEIKQGA